MVQNATMTVLPDRLTAIEADITTLAVDAIVNAANAQLLPGGGVDGAIRRAAGPKLTQATARIGACPTGTAVITGGYDLPARHVIHTAAPVWDGSEKQDALLASCYTSALILADAHGIASIAFPAIGTGIYGWPSEHAAKIAFGAVVRHLSASAAQNTVIFCCFSADDRERYAHLIAELAP